MAALKNLAFGMLVGTVVSLPIIVVALVLFVITHFICKFW